MEEGQDLWQAHTFMERQLEAGLMWKQQIWAYISIYWDGNFDILPCRVSQIQVI